MDGGHSPSGPAGALIGLVGGVDFRGRFSRHLPAPSLSGGFLALRSLAEVIPKGSNI